MDFYIKHMNHKEDTNISINASLELNGGGRDVSLDSIKFILIILVGLCHSLEPFRYSNYLVGSFYSVVYAFHMPLFVMLSGYFSKHVTLEKLKHGVPKLLETYIIMCLVAMVILHYKYELKSPCMSEWYLLSLVFWRIGAGIVNRLKLRQAFVLIISFIAAFAAYVLLDSHSFTLSCMRTMLFLPYFFIGFFITPDSILLIRKHKKIFVLVALFVIIALASVSIKYSRPIHVMEFNSGGIDTVSKLFGHNYLLAISGKIIFYVIGIILCFAFMSFEIKYSRIAKLGRYSLFLYCVQYYFIQIPEKMDLITSLWQSIFLSALVFIIACSITKYKAIQNLISRPLSTLINKTIK